MYFVSAATMICFSKNALVASMMTSALVGVSASTVTTKNFYKGYGASAYASFPAGDCDYIYGSSFSVSAYSTKSRFKSTGNGKFSQSSKFDEFSMYYSESTCDDSKITYRYGNIYDQSNYGDSVPTKFKTDIKNLTEASLLNLELPVFENTCGYVCTEVCYPYYIGYGDGTCSPETELPYLECYLADCLGEDVFIGNAAVSVTWKAKPGTENTQPTFNKYSSRETGPGYTYTSKSKGNYRFDLDVTITATLDGADLFSVEPDYISGDLSDIQSKSVSKSSNQELYRRRMEMLNSN